MLAASLKMIHLLVDSLFSSFAWGSAGIPCHRSLFLGMANNVRLFNKLQPIHLIPAMGAAGIGLAEGVEG